MKIGIAGYSGLVGQACLNALIADNAVEQIIAVGRKNPYPQHQKITFIQSNFENLPQLEADAIICCLGTTIKTAGSPEAFEKVDRHFVLRFREAFKNCQTMAVVSAVGANSRSGIFYNQVKGRMEEDLMGSGLSNLYILHPSILLGKRTEFRLGERIGIALMQVLKLFFIGSLKKFKPIHAQQVAKALINAIKSGEKGHHIYEGRTLFDRAGAN